MQREKKECKERRNNAKREERAHREKKERKERIKSTKREERTNAANRCPFRESAARPRGAEVVKKVR